METCYPIAFKFGTQKGGVLVHIGTSVIPQTLPQARLMILDYKRASEREAPYHLVQPIPRVWGVLISSWSIVIGSEWLHKRRWLLPYATKSWTLTWSVSKELHPRLLHVSLFVNDITSNVANESAMLFDFVLYSIGRNYLGELWKCSMASTCFVFKVSFDTYNLHPYVAKPWTSTWSAPKQKDPSTYDHVIFDYKVGMGSIHHLVCNHSPSITID